MFMPNYSKYDIILVRYPFSDLSNAKIRPTVIVSVPHPSQDIIITPLTSKINSLLLGEFVLQDWLSAGLNVPTAVKRGIYTIHRNLFLKKVGSLAPHDALLLEQSLKLWLGL